MKLIKNYGKIKILFLLMFIFSIIYMFLDDNHFAGVNKFKETIKQEVIKNKAKKEIQENYENFEGEYIKEEIINDVARKSKEEAKKDLHLNNVKPNIFEKYFNRLYFAIISGCLLGYGDIYPDSMICKSLTAIQGLLTVSLIIY